MVKAILAGRKTQTRRVIRFPDDDYEYRPCHRPGSWGVQDDTWAFYDPAYPTDTAPTPVHCPYGGPGDRLWVRETHQIYATDIDSKPDDREFETGRGFSVNYKADGNGIMELWDEDEGIVERWRPSIFMPRWASRITLEVANVRVQRVQDISEEDALADGVDRTNTSLPGYAQERFRRLWESINAKRGYGWDKNVWVWAITFKRIDAKEGA